MNTFTIAVLLIAIALVVVGIYFYWSGLTASQNNSMTNTTKTESALPKADSSLPTTAKNPRAIIETSRGNITIELYPSDAPNTVANFVKLAKEKFYDSVKFHRVIKGFMIQGGDPLTKDDTQASRWGTGGPGYQFADELNSTTKSFQDGYKRRVVAMANAGPNTNGSQFFIMHADYALPRHYTIFGKVFSGIEAVDAIANVPTDQNDRPKSAVVITRITIEE